MLMGDGLNRKQSLPYDDQKQDVCDWVHEKKMSDGYASNLGKCVDKKNLKLFGMRSPDYHIFITTPRATPETRTRILGPQVIQI